MDTQHRILPVGSGYMGITSDGLTCGRHMRIAQKTETCCPQRTAAHSQRAPGLAQVTARLTQPGQIVARVALTCMHVAGTMCA